MQIKTAIYVGIATTTCALLSPLLLPAAGFGAGGVAAGSLAAGAHAVIGNVAAGSVFAGLQSLGATLPIMKLALAGGAIAVSGVAGGAVAASGAAF